MTNEQIFKNAKWIECTGSDAPLFRKSFSAVKGEKAEITICGLGFFKLFINGRKVSDDLLVPNATCYSERDLTKLTFPLKDKLSYRIYCMKYDVTDYLLDGENTLAVMLGNGYYNQVSRHAEGVVTFGTPKLCFLLEKESGNVISDETTLSHNGFVTYNNLYNGEKHDYTLYPQGFKLNSYNGEGFAESTVIPAPESEFFIQFSPADKVIRTIKPILLRDEGDKKLYDIGENTVGYAVFKCKEKGKLIKVNYAEEIYETRRYYGIQLEEGYQEEQFITDGTDREYIPHFTWHGFRYFTVNADVEPLRVDVVHTDCPVTSSFECDNKVLNWLYDAYIRTQLGNIHCSIPSDCPHRERLGYTGDGQLCGETVMMLFDCKEIYRKWLYDVADSQCKVSGHVQHTAPLMGGGGGPSGWGGAIVEVPMKFYKTYGDKDLLNEFFPKMLHFLDYLEDRSDNGLVWHEEDYGWCLGDWCPLGNRVTIPEAFINTYFLSKCAAMTAETAEILGFDAEVPVYRELEESSNNALIKHYYNEDTHSFCEGTQGADAFALDLGLGDEITKKTFIEKYEKLLTFDTGIFGTDLVIRMLFNFGRGDIAYKMLVNEEITSFYNMKKHGATTLWENWDGCDSRCHPMFGAVVEYFFSDILGIKRYNDKAGYKEITVSPADIPALRNVKGTMRTPWGDITVEITADENGKRNIFTETTGDIIVIK